MLSLVFSHLLKYITWVFAWMKMWISLASYILHSLICVLENEILGICLHRHNTFKINSSKWIQTQNKSLNPWSNKMEQNYTWISMSHQLRPLWSSNRELKNHLEIKNHIRRIVTHTHTNHSLRPPWFSSRGLLIQFVKRKQELPVKVVILNWAASLLMI